MATMTRSILVSDSNRRVHQQIQNGYALIKTGASLCDHDQIDIRFCAKMLTVTVNLFVYKIWGFAWWNIDIISVCRNTICLSQLSRSWSGTGSKKNLVAQLVSQLSLSEIMVQGRTNIGQLVSQLSLSENVIQEKPWGFTGRSVRFDQRALIFVRRLKRFGDAAP